MAAATEAKIADVKKLVNEAAQATVAPTRRLVDESAAKARVTMEKNMEQVNKAAEGLFRAAERFPSGCQAEPQFNAPRIERHGPIIAGPRFVEPPQFVHRGAQRRVGLGKLRTPGDGALQMRKRFGGSAQLAE